MSCIEYRFDDGRRRYFRHNQLSNVGGQATLFLCTTRPDCGPLLVMKVFRENNYWIGKSDHVEVLAKIRTKSNSLVDGFMTTILEQPTLSNPVMVMEYCNGGDLLDLSEHYRKKGEYLPETFIWHIYFALTEAIDFLHTGYGRPRETTAQPWRAIVHQDIKPDNIVLMPNPDDPAGLPTPKLTDFDFAAFCDVPQRLSCMNWRYWPPEMDFQSLANPATDVWAVGAVIHELTALRTPIDCKDCQFDPQHCTWEPYPKSLAGMPIVVDSILGPFSAGLNDCLHHTLNCDPNLRMSASALRKKVTQAARMFCVTKTWAEQPLDIKYRSLCLEYWIKENSQLQSPE